MKDTRTLAYINLHAILGSLPLLCEIDEEAHELIKDKKISIGFSVKGGPSATLFFDNGKCEMSEGCNKCSIKLPFSSPKKFNGMIDGTVTPIPSHGFTKIGFLLKTFTRLTDILTKYLRADRESLKDESFFEKSTRLMFGVIGEAIVCIANNDKVGKASASYIVDGKIKLEINGSDSFFIDVKNNILKKSSDGPVMSYMQFKDIKIARALFDGEINAVTAVGLGDVRVGGMMSQIDNLNRILDRVSLYLA